MQKGKHIFHVLATLLAILPIASCKMDGGDIKTASQEEGQPSGSTLIIRTNVSTEEQITTNARSAVPSSFLDTDGNSLVFAGALYASNTQETGKAFQKGEYDNGSLTLAFESTNEERKDYTLEIRAYKGGTESFDGIPLLYGTTTITIETNKLKINAPTVKLKPFKDTTERGNINLEILIPSEYSLSIEAEESEKLSPDIKYTEQKDGYKKYTISASEIQAGIYEVNFLLWNLNEKNVVYLWNEAINVYPGMITDKWNMGSVEGGARKIDKARIFSTFYVKGKDPQSNWFKDLPVSDSEETGSLSRPYTKIQDAIDRVVSINDGSTPFSIYIDGTLTQTQDEAQSVEGMANFSALDKNLNLTIKSLSDTKATLDADKKTRVIYAKPASGKLELTLEKLVIKNGNAADTNGGGTFFQSENGALTLKACEITDNTAKKGGGIYVERASLTMEDTTISGNTATDDGEGGGVYITGSNSVFTMISGEISSNRAYSAGGGIYVEDGVKATISNTKLSENKADSNGGAIYASNNCNLTTEYCVISGNTANQNGGGVYVISSIFTMNDGEIKGGSINDGHNAKLGGGVYVTAGTLAMNGAAKIIDNTASQDGGGVYFSSGTLTINGGTFSRNIANQNGGGVYVTGSTFMMSGGEITENVADQDGGGIYIIGSTFTMTGGKIGNENTAKNGGGVYVKDNGMFTMSGGEISKNNAINGNALYLGQGGGVYVYNAKFEISGTAKISGNTADISGGGVYVYTNSANATLTMTGGEISGNTATNNGGGVYNQNGDFTMTGGEISENTATNNGGGVYNQNGNFTMADGTIISKNTSASKGGGVFLVGTTETSKSTFRMRGGTISENTAYTAKNGDNDSPKGDGGGVSINSNGDFTMTGGTISGNKAVYGAGVHVNDGGVFTMSAPSIISGNIASGNIANGSDNSGGGGIHLFKGTFTMNGGMVSGNKAEGNTIDSGGGGIYIYSGNTFTMTGGTFTENNAGRGKGAFLCKKDGNTGNLNMSGRAKFEINNDVYLYNNKSDGDLPTIHVEGNLTSNPVATITPYKYEANLQVLSVDTDVTMDETLCNKLFSITPDNGTKWKISYDSSSRKGVLENDIVSTESGISVTMPNLKNYTFVVKYNGAPIGNEVISGNDLILEKVTDSNENTLDAKKFTIEIQDTSGIKICSGEGKALPVTVNVPSLPPDTSAQIYVKVELQDGIVIDKTIPVTIGS